MSKQSKKVRKNSGRISPRYHEKFSFKFREKYDYLEHRIMWDNWQDYRDGFRDIYLKYGNKPVKIFIHHRSWFCPFVELLQNIQKWKLLNSIRKIRKKQKLEHTKKTFLLT